MGKMGIDNFGCLNRSFSLFHILFLVCNEPSKNIMAYVGLQLKLLPPPLPSIQAGKLLGKSPFPPPSVHTLWMTAFPTTILIFLKKYFAYIHTWE